MTRSWKLGTAFGIGIYLHWSFLLLPAWVLFATWGILGPQMIVFLLAMVAAIFGCVVLHELGHALMARQFGIPTRDITLYPIGGVARLERMSERPHEELLIALGGPAVNIIIAIALGLVLALSGTVFSWRGLLQSMPGGFLLSLLAANLMLALFNLLPAFPMDGGRVLRALLSVGLGRRQATEIAVYLGAAIAVLLAVAVIVGSANDVPWLSNPILIVVAGFVFFAGQQELRAVRRRRLVRGEEPIEVLPTDAEVVVQPISPAGAGFTGAIWDARSRAWVLWHNGQPIATYGIFSE
jgi:Zn-dependent protease